MAGCIFCAIAAGQAEAARIEPLEGACAFLDARPLFKGHALVVPPDHLETLADVEPGALGALFLAVQRVARAVERGLGAGGTFVAVNNRVSQSVPHLHVHVVPRTRGDGLRGFFWPRTHYASDEERAEYARRISTAL
jgi:histidine triad (HIT) family protein